MILHRYFLYVYENIDWQQENAHFRENENE